MTPWQAAGFASQEEWAEAGWPAPLDPETGKPWEGWKMWRMERGRHPTGRKMTDEDWFSPYTQHILDFVRIRRLYDNPLWSWAEQMRARYPGYPMPGINIEELLRKAFPDWYEEEAPREGPPLPTLPESVRGQMEALGITPPTEPTLPTPAPEKPPARAPELSPELQKWMAWARGWGERVKRPEEERPPLVFPGTWEEYVAPKKPFVPEALLPPTERVPAPEVTPIEQLLERARGLLARPAVPTIEKAMEAIPEKFMPAPPVQFERMREEESLIGRTKLAIQGVLSAPYTFYLRPLFQAMYEAAKVPERAAFMYGEALAEQPMISSYGSDLYTSGMYLAGLVPNLGEDSIKNLAIREYERELEEGPPTPEHMKKAWELGEIGYSLVRHPERHQDAWRMLEEGASMPEIMEKHEDLATEIIGNIIIDPIWLLPPAWMEKILPVGKGIQLAAKGLKKLPGMSYLIDVTKAGRLKTYGYAISDAMDRYMMHMPADESVGGWLGRLLLGDEEALGTLGAYDRKLLTHGAATFKRGDAQWRAIITKYSPEVIAGMPPDKKAAALAKMEQSMQGMAERIIRKTAPADLAEMEALLERDPRKIGRWLAEGLTNLRRRELGLKPIEARGALYRGMAFASQVWKETILPINIAFHQVNLLDSTVRMSLRGYFWDPGDLPVLDRILMKLTGRQPLEVRVTRELEKLGYTLPRELQTGLIRELMDTEGYRLKTRYAMRKVPVPFVGKPRAVFDAFKKLTGNDLVTWAAEASTKGGLRGKIGKLIGAVRFEDASIPIAQAQEMGRGYEYLAKALNRMNLASLVEAGAENLNIEPLVRITTFWKESEPLFNHARLGVADLVESTLLERNPGREAIAREIADQIRNPNTVQSVADLGALLDRYIADAGPKLDGFSLSFRHIRGNKVLQEIATQTRRFGRKPTTEGALDDIFAYGRQAAEENYSKILSAVSPEEASIRQLRLAGAPDRVVDDAVQDWAQGQALMRRAEKRLGSTLKRIEDIRGSDLSFLEVGRNVRREVHREAWQPYWDWFDEYLNSQLTKIEYAKITGDTPEVSRLWDEFFATRKARIAETFKLAEAKTDEIAREFLKGVPTDELIKALAVVPEERVAEAVAPEVAEREILDLQNRLNEAGARLYFSRRTPEGTMRLSGTDPMGKAIDLRGSAEEILAALRKVAPEVAEEAPGLVDRILEQEAERVVAEDASLLERAKTLRDDTLEALGEMQEQALTKFRASKEVAEAVPETLVGLDELKLQAMRQMADGYENAVVKGIETVHELFYDYAARKGVDELLWWASPFTIWQTRNPFGWAKAIAHRPAIVNVMRRVHAFTEAEREERALPGRFKGTVPIPDAIARPLIDRGIIPDGYYAADIRPFFSIWQQLPMLRGELPWGWEDEPILGKVIRAGEFIGIRPYPWWQIGAEELPDILRLGIFDGLKRYPWWQMTLDQLGAYESVPAGDLTYMTKYLKAITKMAGHEVDIEKPLREWRDRNDQGGIARYYANLRLLDYYFEEEISMEDLVEAVSNPGNPSFDKAYQEAADWHFQVGVVRGLETFTVKNATPAEQKARLLQREYFDLPLAERTQYREDNPFLVAYWTVLRQPEEAEANRQRQRREQWEVAIRQVMAAAIAKTPLGSKAYEDTVDNRRSLLDQAATIYDYEEVSPLLLTGLRYQASAFFALNEDFFDEEGNIKEEFSWAQYYDAREAFLKELDWEVPGEPNLPGGRLEFERYLAKNETPAEAILHAWERLYGQMVWDVINEGGNITEAKRRANEGRKDIQGLIAEVLRVHPDWTAEQLYEAKKEAGRIVKWDAWARRNQPLRDALESVLWSGYMGLDDLARRDFRDFIEEHPDIDPRVNLIFERVLLPRTVEKAGKEWKRDINLVSTKVLLILADKVGGLVDLQKEGFQAEIEEAEKEYELERVEPKPGIDTAWEKEVTGILGYFPEWLQGVSGTDAVSKAPVQWERGPRQTDEELRAWWEDMSKEKRQQILAEFEAIDRTRPEPEVWEIETSFFKALQRAVGFESPTPRGFPQPGSEVRGRPPGLASPMPTLPGPGAGIPPEAPSEEEEPPTGRYPGGIFEPSRTPAEEAEYDQAQAEMQAWVAGGKTGDWTPLMEKWFGDPNSPPSLFWDFYWGQIPPGRIADEVRKDPIIEMLLNKAFRTVYDVKPGVYEGALETLKTWREAHPELPGDPQEWAIVRQITKKYWELKAAGAANEASALWKYFAPLLEKYYPTERRAAAPRRARKRPRRRPSRAWSSWRRWRRYPRIRYYPRR